MRAWFSGWRWRDLIPVALLVSVTGAASYFAPLLFPPLTVAEQWLVDLRVALLAPAQPQNSDIVLVVVTEDTLANLPYRSPVDRGFLADLIAWLDGAGARAIGLDILLDQQTEPDKDDRLRTVLRGIRTPIVVAWADAEDGLTDRQAGYLADYTRSMRRGYVTLLTDPYLGVVRWIYPGRTFEGAAVFGFAGALAQAIGLEPPRAVKELAYQQSPDDETPAFRKFPAHAVPFLPKEWFAGRVVLIGSDLPHQDRHRAPMATVYGDHRGSLPGVAVHAHALAQVITGRTAPHIGTPTRIATVALASIAAAVIGALSLSVGIHTLIGLASFAALWLIGFEIYALLGVLVPLVTPSLAFALTFAAGNAYWRGRSRRQSHFIQQAFSRFTSPAVVQALVRDPGTLRLGGEKRQITCLFTDVAGFTSWIEGTPPERALATLNVYLDAMCRIAFEHDGTVNKLVGDALHVLFGAPVDQPDHALRAVRCALAMDAFARRFSAEHTADGIGFGATRIGVHSGWAIVGNFGGDRFFDYTAYGDTVNATARLESANKQLGTLVCVSAATAAGCPGLRFRPIGSLLVVGKNEPIDVLEPLSEGTVTAPLDDYLAAFSLLRNNDPQSQAAFGRLHALWPDDRLVGFHAARLARGDSGTRLRLTEK